MNQENNKSESEWINKAGGFAKTENYRDALDCFEKVLELNPQNTVALIGKGYMLDKTGEKDKGMEYLERGLRVEQSLGESGSQYVKDDLARYHMNIAKTAWDKGLSNKSIQELEQAIKYEPSVDLKVFLTEACATYITLKLEIVKRARSSNDKDLTDDEYNELQKALEMYDTVISLYESLSDDDILKSNFPLHESYAQAKRNSVAFGYFGMFIHDKNGNVTTRISDKTFINKKNIREEKIKEKKQTLESDIKELKQERRKKYSEAGKIAYAKYKNNEPNFTGVSDIRIKWYAVLAIDLEINKINQEMEALNSREKKSGFFAKIGDLISTTAKQGKSKIDLYQLGNKKDNTITEFGEQLYFDDIKGTLNLEELSDIWQDVSELNKEVITKEKEISTLNNS